ncbi:MAG: (Fe-S)-binding protein [Desulfovibrio sp.]|jgi:Fe-S oxidoreductase|nr:(Fe-S)-binding protein [Desulfovibrio sp.]
MARLSEYYEAAKQKVITSCLKCGKCISECRVMPFSRIKIDPRKTQQDIIDFLSGGKELSPAGQFKLNSCMRCYGCLDVQCPIGVNSMLITELLAREIQFRKETPWDIPLYPVHEELARKGTSAEEYERISLERTDVKADYLFFPGCNVYKQPDKILNALDMLDAIGNRYSFAPGLAYCCGSSSRGSGGDADWLQNAAEKLFGLGERLKIKAMIFWCPTCLSVLQSRIRHFLQPSFACISFPRYVMEHISKLEFPAATRRTVTYHEPCKNAYMGIDSCVRQVLRAIPGTELVEMEHHGKDTLCCGCRTVNGMPELGNAVTLARLREAMSTGADTMIDLCHNCHWIFVPAVKSHPELQFPLRIENFSTYVAKAIGIERKDLLQSC